MKSNKQKREQLKAKRARKARRARYAALLQDDATPSFASTAIARFDPSRVRCDPAQLRPFSTYGAPPAFIAEGYQDHPICCIECGAEEIWTASQQKWWYEVMKGSIYSRAVRCRACRRRRRAIRSAANERRLAGMEKKRQAKRLAPSSQRRKL
ncbi:zinc-ribbon domain containing protein [Blastopirellula marina]|uniref:Probable zinc-binding domain-containing protein n=1 Tax=Blastopirellula marina DSM 3645 TaxID=314230 RepID=A3ZRX4_9BACT|nr:zinc-ribbon domain containing protein [Blastopirellula marina]EAQ80896.1 hypothetical protein DSM3645_12786 [Blastopirellula marina DSM 3645]